MTTLNNVVLFVVVLVLFGSVACGDSDSPTAPSSASSATMAEAPSFGPSTSVRTTPASFTPDNLKPSGGARTDDEGRYNAYDFYASWDGAMLSVRLVEDNMRAMREASRPHRTRRIEVQSCPAEPGYHGQRDRGCVQIWAGSLMLSGTVNLDPIPLEACPGWLTVHAAELSDDKGNRNGYRNAPCPADDETEVGSDGSGDGWPSYPDATPKDRTRTPTPPVVMAHSLPFSYGDPRGDVTLCCNDEGESYSGSRPAVDLTRVTLSDQDANGWITVTLEVVGAFDLDAIVASEPELPEPPLSVSHSIFVSFPDETFNVVRGQGEGWRVYQFGRAWSNDIRLPTTTTGRVFSFGIRPSANSRGGTLSRLGSANLYGVTFGFDVSIRKGSPVFNRILNDSIMLPDDFTLPNLP